MSHVSNHKYTWHIGFQKSGITVQLPSLGSLSLTHEIGAGKNESPLIAFDNIRKPIRIWSCSDHYEKRACRYLVNLVGGGAENGYRFEMIVTMRLYNRRIEFYLDVSSLLQLVD